MMHSRIEIKGHLSSHNDKLLYSHGTILQLTRLWLREKRN